MEDKVHGHLGIHIMLATENEYRIRRVKVFGSWGAEDTCKRDADKFLSKNPDLTRLQLDIRFQPESKSLTYDDLKEAAGKIARVKNS